MTTCVCAFLAYRQKKVVEQLRKELLVKQEPEAKVQLQVHAPPVGGDVNKPTNLMQSQQIPAGLQQVRNTHALIYRSIDLNVLRLCHLTS